MCLCVLQRRGSEFTLIELLVVITIISILLSLLLPSLGRARFNTKVAVCLSQQKQWGSTLYALSLDDAGKLPDYAWTRNSYNAIDVSASFKKLMLEDHDFPLEVLSCPLKESQYRTEDWLDLSGGTKVLGYYYWLNRVSNYFGDKGVGKFISENDPDMPLVSDSVMKLKNQAQFTASWGSKHEYNGKMINVNILYIDGSAKVKPFGQVMPIFTSFNAVHYR